MFFSAAHHSFSPVDAGNARLEGLYFDRQSSPTSRLIEGSSIRVGIAAQSYPFPSPTGIVDYNLRRVGEQQVVSAVLTYGPFGGTGAEVDAQLPIARDRFRVAAGAGISALLRAARRQLTEGGGSPDEPAYSLY